MSPLLLVLASASTTVGVGVVSWLLWQSWVEAGDDGLAELDDEVSL